MRAASSSECPQHFICAFSHQLPIAIRSLLCVHMALLTQENKLFRGQIYTANISGPSTVPNTMLKINLKISMVLSNLPIINKNQIW